MNLKKKKFSHCFKNSEILEHEVKIYTFIFNLLPCKTAILISKIFKPITQV